MQAKNIVITVLVLALIGAVAMLTLSNKEEATNPNIDDAPVDVLPVEPDGGIGDGAEPLSEVEQAERGNTTLIGASVSGSEIIAHHFGEGEKEILLVGGVHGGYSPSTAKLASELMAYYGTHESEIPSNLTLTIIPNLNPDGATKSGAAGRFNANNVDLNRNFDCDWSATGVWQNREVSGGTAPFSEPEAAALRDYVNTYDPAAAVVWFGAEGKVYPSACEGTPSKASVTLAATFASAAGYPAEAEFDAYAITGDMVNWMAKQGIPAISVLLTTHEGSEFEKNLAGVQAILNAYAE